MDIDKKKMAAIETVMNQIEEGKAHVLGSDCHGAHHRVPNLQDGRDILEKKAGKEVLEQIDRQGEKLLSAILK